MSNTYTEFLQNGGLYDKVEINRENIEELISLIAGEVKIDSYCKDCESIRVFSMESINYFYYDEQDGTFESRKISDELIIIQKLPKLMETPVPGKKAIPMDWKWSNCQIEKNTRTLHFVFSCAMDDTHKIDYIVRTEGNTMIKIGQYPSVADLSFPKLKEYKKVLPKEDMNEMRRAIGLYAQGIGVGSYVYLRRILERIIDKAKEQAISDANITEEAYSQSKVVERIKMLKDYLPSMLTSNTTIYGIVSKGIHELSEEECIEYFPVLQDCIFMILEKWEQDRKVEEREAQLSASISKIAGKVK